MLDYGGAVMIQNVEFYIHEDESKFIAYMTNSFSVMNSFKITYIMLSRIRNISGPGTACQTEFR
jgi:hypothetical protein